MSPTAGSLSFDPHPHGCPVGVRATPSEMPDLVSAICLKLRDVLRASIYVINPSKGQPYPVLFLHSDSREGPPLVALFPEYEDDGRRRRVDYARQTTLLQRIAEAGVPGETFDSYRGFPSARTGAGPAEIALAADDGDMDAVLHDLYERLGEMLRITVTRMRLAERTVPVLRVYVLDDERSPRMVIYPARIGGRPVEGPLRDELMSTLFDLSEMPIEALFA